MASKILKIEVLDSIKSIEKNEWGQLTTSDFPFTQHAFLKALESSEVISEASGWTPELFCIRENGHLVGASNCYSKTNSYGEYIFDWAWADAYHRNEIPYYPKIVSSSPFTPATGPKLLLGNHPTPQQLAETILKATEQSAWNRNFSSLHYLFINPEERCHFETAGFMIRHSYQYHWHNQSYSNFDDFLSALKPKRRKQIIRERTQLKSAGLKFKIVQGDEIDESHAEVFYHLYLTTIKKMQAIPYLNLNFFKEVFSTMSDQIMLILAEINEEIIAGALYFTSEKKLYGRYWGATQDIRNLHFELCYYLPIQWSIDNNIELFEAGAQGEHKIARGFRPQLTYSAHKIRHPDFKTAIDSYIEHEKSEIKKYFLEIKKRSPFRT